MTEQVHQKKYCHEFRRTHTWRETGQLVLVGKEVRSLDECHCTLTSAGRKIRDATPEEIRAGKVL